MKFIFVASMFLTASCTVRCFYPIYSKARFPYLIFCTYSILIIIIISIIIMLITQFFPPISCQSFLFLSSDWSIYADIPAFPSPSLISGEN